MEDARKPALIYNLFPLLAGPLPGWRPHLERAAAMGFNWIFVNPLQYPGFSGSLYAIKDHYRLNPLVLDDSAGVPGDKQLAGMLQAAHDLGLRVMLDLVVNHTAVDSLLAKQHPQWYKRDKKGQIVNPGYYEGDKLVTVWGDLGEIDNENSPEREALWEYWWKLADHYLGLGFDGFRADAAYKVPRALWEFLIGRSKDKYPDCMFFAESLGCPIEQTVELAKSGFDYIFNSSKWWDFRQPWLLRQYRQTRETVPSVSFPESHDTPRLLEEEQGDREAARQRIAFAALFSAGFMLPVGGEYGFRQRLHVVDTRPGDWEQTKVDLTGFIRRCLEFKLAHPIFCAEHPTYDFELHPESGAVTGLVKVAGEDGPSALLLVNRDKKQAQRVKILYLALSLRGQGPLRLVDPLADFQEEQFNEEHLDRELPPSGFLVLLRG